MCIKDKPTKTLYCPNCREMVEAEREYEKDTFEWYCPFCFRTLEGKWTPK